MTPSLPAGLFCTPPCAQHQARSHTNIMYRAPAVCQGPCQPPAWGWLGNPGPDRDSLGSLGPAPTPPTLALRELWRHRLRPSVLRLLRAGRTNRPVTGQDRRTEPCGVVEVSRAAGGKVHTGRVEVPGRESGRWGQKEFPKWRLKSGSGWGGCREHTVAHLGFRPRKTRGLPVPAAAGREGARSPSAHF